MVKKKKRLKTPKAGRWGLRRAWMRRERSKSIELHDDGARTVLRNEGMFSSESLEGCPTRFRTAGGQVGEKRRRRDRRRKGLAGRVSGRAVRGKWQWATTVVE